MNIFDRFHCQHKNCKVIYWQFKDTSVHRHTEEEQVIVKVKCLSCGKIFKKQMSNIEMQKEYYL